LKKLYSTVYERNNEGKWEILDILLTNCTLNAENLCSSYLIPFDFLEKGPSGSMWLLKLGGANVKNIIAILYISKHKSKRGNLQDSQKIAFNLKVF